MSSKTEDGGGAENLYRLLPSVNELLLLERVETLRHLHPRPALLRAIRTVLDAVRTEIAAGVHSRESLQECIEGLPDKVGEELRRPFRYSLRRVINATGVVLHTNLGRAPLSKQALEHIAQTAGGYSNLEFDFESGERGTRDVHGESLLLDLISQDTGLEGLHDSHRAIVVNNCAAATYLTLHALAKGREVVVSRGELVEIGGGFRIPEILEQSGAVLKEVGTTNRTRISDYEKALGSNTGMILRVHPSNFSMEGFVARPALGEVVALAKRTRVPVFFDQGTGLVHRVSAEEIEGETTLADAIAHGCDVVAASGDKLLGGPQSGILIGRRDLIDRIRRDPMFRTFRVDKLIYAALEATLASYLSARTDEIPILRFLSQPVDELRLRCEQIAGAIRCAELQAEAIPVESVIGGGTAPRARLASWAVRLRQTSLDAAGLLKALRKGDPAIVGRIEEEAVLLDLRTVDADSDAALIDALRRVAQIAENAGEEARTGS